MTRRARGLVLDANILIRLTLGTRVRELVQAAAGHVNLFTPEECYTDAHRYLPALLTKRGIDPTAATTVLDGFTPIIRPLAENVYAAARDDSLARIAARDEQDWPILAAALTLDLPIWTEDQDFFGTGVATWTTDRVAIYIQQSRRH